MSTLLQDLRYSVRQLAKSPGFTIASVLTLAIGIGANTAIFSNMDAVVLRPLAVPRMDRVVTVGEQQIRAADYLAGDQPTALANYEDWKRLSGSFEELAVRTGADMSLTGAGDAAHVQVALTSANFFDVLRAKAFLGRVFTAAECQPGRDGVAVLNYSFWQQHFGADPGVVGRTVQLDQRAYQIAGVMPKTLQYPSMVDVFLPFAPTPQQLANRGVRNAQVLGRLRAGVSVAQAQAEMRTIARHLAKAYPATNQEWSVKIEPLLDGINGPLTNLYYKLVMGATLFVLLVVCANIANLQFARGIARRPEVAMRTALGASRTRIVRQMLTESILLGGLGAAGGIAFGAIYLHLTLITMPARVARYMAGWSNISLNGRALAFSVALAMAAGVIAGIAPALQALRLKLVDQLKSGSRSQTGSAGGRLLRSIFAVSQVALAVALVIGAALMAKGMTAMLHLADAYRPEKILTFMVSLPPKRYDTPEKQAAWYAATLDKLRALPGVTHAEIGGALPYSDIGWTQDFNIENRPAMPGKAQSAMRLPVSVGYFEAFHVPIVAGRGFTAGDSLRTVPVAVVSRRFAQNYLAGENPLGRRIRMGGVDSRESWVTIVGVVEEVRYSTWDSTPRTEVYLDSAQLPPEHAMYAVMTDGDAKALAPEARKALGAVDAAIPLDVLMTYRQYLNELLLGLQYSAAMLGIDALIAMLLAAIGIFGVMANTVGERTREIGLRLAMGARREDVLRMVLGRATRLMAVGLAAGLVMAFALARMVANLLVGVKPDDPLVFASITATTALVALLASWIPARRASRVEPMVALRDE